MLTAPMGRLERPVAAEIVVYVLFKARAYGSGNEFGDYSAPLIHEVRRGECWCAGGSPLAPVAEYVAPALVPPVYSTTTVTTGLVYPQFSSTAVVPSAPCVVGSLPPVEEFIEPVYDHVHQEHIAASELTEKSAEFPVVQEQVIVQGKRQNSPSSSPDLTRDRPSLGVGSGSFCTRVLCAPFLPAATQQSKQAHQPALRKRLNREPRTRTFRVPPERCAQHVLVDQLLWPSGSGHPGPARESLMYD